MWFSNTVYKGLISAVWALFLSLICFLALQLEDLQVLLKLIWVNDFDPAEGFRGSVQHGIVQTVPHTHKRLQSVLRLKVVNSPIEVFRCRQL